MIWNASVSYNITDDMKVSGIANSIENSMPRRDATWMLSYTFYPYGRAYSLSSMRVSAAVATNKSQSFRESLQGSAMLFLRLSRHRALRATA